MTCASEYNVRYTQIYYNIIRITPGGGVDGDLQNIFY